MPNEAKHAPISWVAEFDDDGQESTTIRNHGGAIIAIVFGVEDFPCLTEEQAADPTIAAEMVANAHLIAAAPDLLAAAHEVCRVMSSEPAFTLEDALNKAYNLCRAAIARAEGRS